MICPTCRSANTMTTADGRALCFECRGEWNPNELVAGPAPVIAPFAMATVAEVFGPPPEVRAELAAQADRDLTREVKELEARVEADADAMLYDLIGQVATLEGGQVTMVVDVLPADLLKVATVSGDLIDVPIADVESVVPMPAEIQEAMRQQGDHTQEEAQ